MLGRITPELWPDEPEYALNEISHSTGMITVFFMSNEDFAGSKFWRQCGNTIISKIIVKRTSSDECVGDKSAAETLTGDVICGH